MKDIFISDIEVDGVPTGIALIGLPEKWLENVVLENITIKNAQRGARINRAKNLTLRNVNIQSEDRAMVLSNVYEVTFDNVTLSDNTGDKALEFSGGYLGALVFGDYPIEDIKLGEGVSESILTDGPREQRW
jgi:hypothetical protein